MRIIGAGIRSQVVLALIVLLFSYRHSLTAAMADTAGSAAAYVATQRCPGDPPTEKLIATTSVSAGAYAAVGVQCGSAAWIDVIEQRGSTWTKLGDTLSDAGLPSNPFAMKVVPGSVAGTLWNRWRLYGSSQNATPGSRSDITEVQNAALHRNPGLTIDGITVIGDWALLGWSMTESGGEELWHRVSGAWTRVAGGGGAMDVTLISAFGVPYAIAQRLIGRPSASPGSTR
jgi:hypothetical protein